MFGSSKRVSDNKDKKCDTFEKVKKETIDYDIQITNVDNSLDGNFYSFTSDSLVLLYDDKEKLLNVSFHVSVTVEYACNLILKFKENIQEIKTIRVFDSFIFSEDGSFKSGKDAYQMFDEMIKNSVIKRYQQDMLINHILLKEKEDGDTVH